MASKTTKTTTPRDLHTARCRYPDCQAPIFWVRSATSTARMCLDATPEKRVVVGELALGQYNAPDGAVLVGYAHGDHAAVVARVVDTYLDHHATCRHLRRTVHRETVNGFYACPFADGTGGPPRFATAEHLLLHVHGSHPDWQGKATTDGNGAAAHDATVVFTRRPGR